MSDDPRPPDPYQQALLEVGQTRFDAGVAGFLAAAFLLAIGLVPLLEGVRAARAGKTDLPAGIVRSSVVETIRALEDAIDNHSLLTGVLRPRGQSFLTGVLGVGNEKAYCGKDGWLFYPPDLHQVVGPPFLDERVLRDRARRGGSPQRPTQPDPVKAILAFHEQLARRGISLVVVPTPDKVAIQPEKFSGRYENRNAAAPRNSSFEEFERRLEEKGVHVWDPAPALLEQKRSARRPMYLATDTHWTPEGAAVAARALADFLLRKGALPPAASAAASPYLRRPEVVEGVGDVAALLGLPPDLSPYRPERVTIEKIFSLSGAPWEPDPRSDVLVLGDSFSNIYHLAGMGWGSGAGFVEQLSAALERPVDAILQNDAGSHATRERLARDLSRGIDRLAGKRVVVWQFASRELSEGDWRLVGLPEAPAVLRAETGRPGRLTGRIASLLPPPKPGSAPYPDCFAPLHLSDVSWGSGGAGEKEVVVWVWVLRKGRATPEAALRPGQSVTLDVVPFANVERRVETFQHLDFHDDEKRRSLPAYWAEREDAPPSAPTAAPASVAPPAGPLVLPGAPARGPEAFRTSVAALAAEAENRNEAVVEGQSGWLFLTAELRHVGAAKSLEAGGDPVRVIADFARQLAAHRIDLILVPVPPKAIVYPETLPARIAAAGVPRLDASHEHLYENLGAHGVELVDLVPIFLALRLEAPLYARTDSHWSGRGVELAAAAVAAAVRRRPWVGEIPRETFAAEPWTAAIAGDLSLLLHPPSGMREMLALTRVTRGGQPVESRRGSPVLLLGDSHALVYNAGGDLLATSSGLPDHLAKELGFPGRPRRGPRLRSHSGARGPRAARPQRDEARRVVPVRARADGEPVARRPPSRAPSLSRRAALVFALLAPGCRRAAPPPATGDTVAVLRIVKTSALPDPKKNPYGDCLVIAKASVERVESGRAVAGAVLVALWGFRDRAVQPAAAFRPEMRIRARLIPWAEVSKDIERLQQVDDVAEYALPLYFAKEATIDGEAAAARKRAMDADLARIGALKSRHGGDYDAWRGELAGIQSELLRKMREAPEPLASKGQRLGEAAFLQYDTMAHTFDPALAMLVKLRDELSRRGTDLVVVPIPWKEEVIAPLFVPGVPEDGVLVPGRVALLEALLRADIEVVDLFPAWRHGVLAGEPVFYEAVDVHPADHGVQLMTRTIAERLSRYRFERTGSFLTRPVTFSPPESQTTFPKGTRLTATEVSRADGRSLGDGGASPVLVIGDCFVAGPLGAPEAGPVSHLARELGIVPASLEQAGGGAHMMVTLARKGPAFLEGRRVCIFLSFLQYFFVPVAPEGPGSPYHWTVVALPRPGEPASRRVRFSGLVRGRKAERDAGQEAGQRALDRDSVHGDGPRPGLRH